MLLLHIAIVLQTVIISLGVGASTLAIINFFVAIWDGSIDVNERRMMGVVYTVLRIAMWLIFGITIVVALSAYLSEMFSIHYISQVTLILILFANAKLMTLHLIPSSYGPPIQASTWYSLGLLSAFQVVNWSLSYLQFLIFYFIMLFLATIVINSIMMYSTRQQTVRREVN